MATAQNDIYDAVYGRHNVIKKIIYQIFISIGSWPRLLLEVFVRKEFGQRYFSLSTSCILTIILASIPYIANRFKSYGNTDLFTLFIDNIVWYSFLGLFIFFCIKRQKEIKRRGNVYTTKYFTLSAGISNPKINYYSLVGKYATPYRINTTLEPAIFLILGMLLFLLSQKLLGLTLIFCSIIYAMSWRAQFALGHEHYLDMFDKIICNEEKISSITGKKSRTGFDGFFDGTLDEETANRLFDNEDDVSKENVKHEQVF